MSKPSSEEDKEVYIISHNHCEKLAFFEKEYLLRIMDCFENIMKKNIQITSTSSGFENYIYMIKKLQKASIEFENHSDKTIRKRLLELDGCIVDNTSYEIFKYINNM